LQTKLIEDDCSVVLVLFVESKLYLYKYNSSHLKYTQNTWFHENLEIDQIDQTPNNNFVMGILP